MATQRAAAVGERAGARVCVDSRRRANRRGLQGRRWRAGGQELFAFATNPFLGLLVGIIATSLIQSSSTVTSIIVGLVAGGLPVVIAVPMVMGANVGTTITNTLVSLGHVAEKREFRRAFAAATIHDCFNLLNIVIFLPLEILFHPLERLGLFIGNLLVGGVSYAPTHLNVVSGATKPVIKLFAGWTHVLPHPFDGLLTIIVGVILIFISISLISKLLKALMVGRAKEIMHFAIGRGPLAGIAAGTGITVLVQSSSTTTSLIVPLARRGCIPVGAGVSVYRWAPTSVPRSRPCSPPPRSRERKRCPRSRLRSFT